MAFRVRSWTPCKRSTLPTSNRPRVVAVKPRWAVSKLYMKSSTMQYMMACVELRQRGAHGYTPQLFRSN